MYMKGLFGVGDGKNGTFLMSYVKFHKFHNRFCILSRNFKQTNKSSMGKKSVFDGFYTKRISLWSISK